MESENLDISGSEGCPWEGVGILVGIYGFIPICQFQVHDYIFIYSAEGKGGLVFRVPFSGLLAS